jgi:hypothetical protein
MPFDPRVANELKRIADALEYFVECDRIAAEAEIRRRTTPLRPVELGTMEYSAAQQRYDHERVEDGFPPGDKER